MTLVTELNPFANTGSNQWKTVDHSDVTVFTVDVVSTQFLHSPRACSVIDETGQSEEDKDRDQYNPSETAAEESS